MAESESLTLRAGLNQQQRSPGVSYSFRDNLLRVNFTGPFKGLDTNSNLVAMSIDYLRIADNAEIDAVGAVVQRKGYVDYLLTDWNTNIIRQGFEFRFGSTTQRVVYGHTNVATSGVFGKISGGLGVTNIKSSLSETARPSMVSLNGLLFFYNGVDDFLYDGTNTRQIGITQPTVAPANGGAVAGSLLAASTYIYSYTYYNSVTGAESSPSPLGTFTGSTGYNVNVVPGNATTADTIRLYRTVANGAVLFLDNTGAIGVTSINSTQGDAGLGKELELDNTRPGIYGLFKYATVANGRVYLGGLTIKPNRVHASAIYTEGIHPESFPVTHFCDCESTKGSLDTNVGLGVANEVTIVLKTQSVGRIEQIGASDVSSSIDAVLFNYKEIAKGVSAVSHHAQTNVYGELVWMGQDDIYATDGTQVRSVAQMIRPTLKSLNFSDDNHQLSAVNDERNKKVIFLVRELSSSPEPDIAIVGSYHAYPEFYWTIYRNYSFASLFYSPLAGGILAGSSAEDGKIYLLDRGNVDIEDGINFKMRTAPISFAMDEEEKLFSKNLISAQGDGSDYSLTARSIYNLTSSTEESAFVSLNQDVSKWGFFNWGEANWALLSPTSYSYYSHRKAYYKQLQLENTNTDKPVAIYGFTITARPTAFK